MATEPVKLVDQRLRYWTGRATLLALLPLLLLSGSTWASWPWAYLTLESLGVALMLAAILGRMWATLYIGGRKNGVMVVDGPYSACRHPLYFFSILGAVGLGLLLASLTLALVLGGATAAILSATAAREERALHALFGDDYARYAARVPRLIPRWRQMQTPQEVVFRPAALRTNLLDSLAFLALIPVAQAMKLIRGALVEPWIHLP